MTFGEFLKTKRQEVNLSISELSKKMGVTVQYVSDVERNRRYPFKGEVLIKCRNALKLSFEDSNILFDMANRYRDNPCPLDVALYLHNHPEEIARIREAAQNDGRNKDSV